MKYFAYVLLILTVLPAVSAAPGAGLVYGVESEVVSSNQKICVEYGVYNPFDIDSKISLSSEGEISEFVDSSDSVEVPASTSRDDAHNAKICYVAPDLRTKKCKIPYLLCKYECDIEEKMYEGQVLASPEASSDFQGTGSSVGMSIAAPFNLLVKCEESDYNYFPLFFISGGILFLIILFFVLRWRKKKTLEEDYRRRREYQRRYQQQNWSQQGQQQGRQPGGRRPPNFGQQ